MKEFKDQPIKESFGAMKRIIVLLIAMFMFQGCFPIAMGYMAYTMSEARTASAEKMQRSLDLRTYTQYRVAMERVNLDREKAKLRPNPIMTQEEWISAQTAGRPVIAPAKGE